MQNLWEEGRGLGVYRSIPAQMNVVKDKWDAATLASPLRTYLYQHVGDEKEALQYRPGQGEDEDKWEDAIQKRPAPDWVPQLVRGFGELGYKVKLQEDALARCNMMLQEINNSLDMQLEIHQQKVAARLAECKRRQLAISRRTLTLAVKVQILRNKGYVMDNAEEELKGKLEKLEKEVFDPSLDAREQEIWARMLGIRERAKRLKVEMERVAPIAASEEPTLDEATIKTAKQVCISSQMPCANTNRRRFWMHMTRNYDIFRKSSSSSSKNTLTGRSYRRHRIQSCLGDEDKTGVSEFGYQLLVTVGIGLSKRCTRILYNMQRDQVVHFEEEGRVLVLEKLHSPINDIWCFRS